MADASDDVAGPATPDDRCQTIDFARRVLSPGGAFVAKVLQGGSEKEMMDSMRRDFAVVKHAKPPASRRESSEL